MIEPFAALQMAWSRFASVYPIYRVPPEAGGYPGTAFWSEMDVVFFTAREIAQLLTWEWVHLEVTGFGGSRAVDLCLSNPEQYRALMSTRWPGFGKERIRIDLAVEFKIVHRDDGIAQYSLTGVENDARKLSTLLDEGMIEAGAICIVDKRIRPKRPLSARIGNIPVLAVRDTNPPV